MSIPYKLPQNEAKKRRRNALIDLNKDDEKIANYQYEEEENGEYSDGEFIDDYDHVFSDEYTDDDDEDNINYMIYK